MWTEILKDAQEVLYAIIISLINENPTDPLKTSLEEEWVIGLIRGYAGVEICIWFWPYFFCHKLSKLMQSGKKVVKFNDHMTFLKALSQMQTQSYDLFSEKVDPLLGKPSNTKQRLM